MFYNAGIGVLENANAHASSSFSFKSFSNGFFETGTGFNNLLRIKYANIGYLGFGGAVFYRHGDYQFEKASDNFLFKAMISFSL